MTDSSLVLSAGLDRSLAWLNGDSVRYLVADLSARGGMQERQQQPLNLGLCVDVSGSMSGPKIIAARDSALAVAASLNDRDRLSIVAFDNQAEVLLDAQIMDAQGRVAATTAIQRLRPRGNTHLFDGWLQAAERVATTMPRMPNSTPRVLILSDGHANVGLVDGGEIAVHVGALLERGVLTSALGIGDGYDERLLGTIAAAGGGSLHDAAGGSEIAEVVLGELLEGRSSLLERVTLQVSVPSGLRAEVVGTWAVALTRDGIDATVGGLLPEQVKRVVVRLYCPAGEPGAAFAISLSARGRVPGGEALIEAQPVAATLRLAHAPDNDAQGRDFPRSLAVVNAWQADVVRNAVTMNRDGDYRAARSYVEKELRLLERYARGVPGTEPMLRELAIVQRNIHEEWDERTRKEVFNSHMKMSRSETDRRSQPRTSLEERLRSVGLRP